MTVIWITPLSSFVEETKSPPSFKKMSQWVDGPVERWEIRIDDGTPKGKKAWMWGNEEAQLRNLPLNPIAVDFCRTAARLLGTVLTQNIYGNVLIVHR